MRAWFLLALVGAGCLAPYGGQGVGSGMYGVAMMGPTCPVEREPPDPSCADRPFEGKLTATSLDGGVVGTFSTDARGRFNLSVPAGSYEIRAAEPNRLPTCSTAQPVLVVAGQWTPVEVSCDTGIR